MNKNIKIIAMLISSIVIFVVSICAIKKIFIKQEIETVEVNVYSKVKLSEIINDKQKILAEDFYIDTSTLRESKVTYSYYDKSDKVHDSIIIKVVDKEKPYAMLGKSYTYVIGTKFDMENTVFCGDNVTKKPKRTIIGKYDLNEVGEYPLVFKVEDESGNTNEIEFTLNVIKEKTTSKSSYLSFEELNNRLPDNANLMIDVSKWQEDIDWKTVSDSGIKYAMLRLGTQKGVDLDSRIDAYFDKNIKEAQANGIKVGVYYFTYANDTLDAKKQAKWVIDVLKDYSLDLPVAFDWECWDLFDDFNMNFYELNVIADTFLKELDKEGYDTLLYGSKNYIENVWTYLDYDIWLAHYTKETTYQGEKLMWQFTSSGRVPGIKGNVDVNFYYNK